MGRLCSKDLKTDYNKYDIDRLALFEWEVVDVTLFSLFQSACHYLPAYEMSANSAAEKFNMLTDIISLDRYECFPW